MSTGYLQCRSCDGIGKKVFVRDGHYGTYTKEVPCRACDGTGINQRLYSKNCEKCYAEIVYPRDATYPPKFCKSCKEQNRIERERKAAEWQTTNCKICRSEIKYNVNWTRIPDTCKPCIEREKAKWKEKSCKSCSATIKYNVEWSKIPDLCKSCIEKEKAKWKESRCKSCGSAIRYNVDWSRVPDMCKPCIEREKAMWSEKSCAKCGAKVRYRKDWDKVPDLCKSCKDKFHAERKNQEYLIGQLRARSAHTPYRTGRNRDNGTLYLQGSKTNQPIHVTQVYDDGFHVSWDAMPDGSVSAVHWTNHKTGSHEPPSDALI